jgi:hypothetical protein
MQSMFPVTTVKARPAAFLAAALAGVPSARRAAAVQPIVAIRSE